MTKHLRRGALVLTALLTATFLAGPASAAALPAAPSPTPCPTDTSYAAPGVCQLVAQVKPVCVDDVPQLTYSLTEMGTTVQTATIVWVHPGGTDVVLKDQPLSGTLLWPGAVLDSQGKAVDWPGWTKQADGSWTRGDAFDWARQPVEVRFEVNPSTVATVSYPAGVGCEPANSAVLAAEDPAPTSSVRSAVLAATGSDVGPYALGGAGLVLLGALILLVRAAMHRQARQTRRSTT